MRQTACLVVNPVAVDSYAFPFKMMSREEKTVIYWVFQTSLTFLENAVVSLIYLENVRDTFTHALTLDNCNGDV